MGGDRVFAKTSTSSPRGFASWLRHAGLKSVAYRHSACGMLVGGLAQTRHQTIRSMVIFEIFRYIGVLLTSDKEER